jgi:hypothetical protein
VGENPALEIGSLDFIGYPRILREKYYEPEIPGKTVRKKDLRRWGHLLIVGIEKKAIIGKGSYAYAVPLHAHPVKKFETIQATGIRLKRIFEVIQKPNLAIAAVLNVQENYIRIWIFMKNSVA